MLFHHVTTGVQVIKKITISSFKKFSRNSADARLLRLAILIPPQCFANYKSAVNFLTSTADL